MTVLDQYVAHHKHVQALYKDLLGLLYERHPIKDLVVGTVESIAQITPEILYDCHKKFYAPSNMILCVVGDVDPQTVADIAEEVLPAGRAEIPKADFGEPEGLLPVKNRSERRMEVSLPQFLLGAKVPYVKSREERIAAQMSLRLMFGRSSAFYNRLYAAKLINRDFDYETDYLSETAMVNIGGESSSPEAAADEILKELERVTREGLNVDDFRRAKRASIGGHLRILEDFDTLGDDIVSNAFEGLDYLDYLDVLDRVTIEDCEKYVRENLQPERFALALLLPGKETEC